MAQIYYQLIKKGKKTLEDVPENLRIEVEALLALDNAETNNNSIS